MQLRITNALGCSMRIVLLLQMLQLCEFIQVLVEH